MYHYRTKLNSGPENILRQFTGRLRLYGFKHGIGFPTWFDDDGILVVVIHGTRSIPRPRLSLLITINFIWRVTVVSHVLHMQYYNTCIPRRHYTVSNRIITVVYYTIYRGLPAVREFRATQYNEKYARERKEIIKVLNFTIVNSWREIKRKKKSVECINFF